MLLFRGVYYSTKFHSSGHYILRNSNHAVYVKRIPKIITYPQLNPGPGLNWRKEIQRYLPSMYCMSRAESLQSRVDLDPAVPVI